MYFSNIDICIGVSAGFYGFMCCPFYSLGGSFFFQLKYVCELDSDIFSIKRFLKKIEMQER